MSAGVEWLLVGLDAVTSRDLITWTVAPEPPFLSTCVAWNGQRWVVGTASSGMFTSVDGRSWVHAPSVVDSGRAREVVWTGDRFIVVGNWTVWGSPRVVAVSDDGTTWASVSTPIDGLANVTLAAVDGDGDEWVAVGVDDTGSISDPLDATILHTADGGLTWTEATLPGGMFRAHSTDGFNQVAGHAGAWVVTTSNRFAAGGPSFEDIAQVLQSSDGLTWTLVQPATEVHDVFTVGRLDDLYVVSGHDRIANTGVVLTSTDGGVTWGDKHTAPGFEPFPLFHANGVMFGFSSDDVYSSTDGVTWTLRYSPPAALAGVAFGGKPAGLPPLRYYPRDDATGGSPRTDRSSTSRQSSARQGWTNTYR